MFILYVLSLAYLKSFRTQYTMHVFGKRAYTDKYAISTLGYFVPANGLAGDTKF